MPGEVATETRCDGKTGMAIAPLGVMMVHVNCLLEGGFFVWDGYTQNQSIRRSVLALYCVVEGRLGQPVFQSRHGKLGS